VPEAGPREQWRRALAEAFPGATFVNDTLLSEMRLVKSTVEIDLLRRAGAASASAFLAGLRTIGTGRRQREAEAAIVGVCLTQGDGVSFWPWAMSGPAAVYPRPWSALRDPQHLDRIMESGELVRLDVGCAYGGYMGDVGRTVPVSGTFSEEQRET
jgi:Xaa-Pro aminopeptidase